VNPRNRREALSDDAFLGMPINWRHPPSPLAREDRDGSARRAETGGEEGAEPRSRQLLHSAVRECANSSFELATYDALAIIERHWSERKVVRIQFDPRAVEANSDRYRQISQAFPIPLIARIAAHALSSVDSSFRSRLLPIEAHVAQ